VEKLVFGTAGIPLCVKNRDAEEGIREVVKLGLGAMELEFVRGVKMGVAKAKSVRNVAKKLGVVLTAHGPYYINLNSKEGEKRRASIKRILDTARVGWMCGAFSITFHPAYYHNDPPEKVYEVVKSALSEIVETLSSEGNKVWVRPETTGKKTQFGTLEEIIRLSEELEQVLPCVDFSHLHARTGKYNTYDEFSYILESIENLLGRDALEQMHSHVQGIEYGEKGEINHLNLQESDFNYVELLKAMVDFDVKGVVICESPNIEEDALLLQKTYNSLI
jgi:deoxyribonuclease-4